MKLLGTRIKESAYGLVGKIKKDVRERTGVAGKVADFVDDTIETGKKMHGDIKNSGGYGAAAKRTGKTISDSFRENVYDRAKRFYNSIENDLSTNGEIDPEKVKAILKNKAEAVKKYGSKGYKCLSELASQGVDTIKKDYHKFIPTDEDLRTKYAGIGGNYRGILFIEDYEACLDFRRKVQRKIPKSTRLRKQILEDIKISASNTKEELVKFYAWQVTQQENGRSAPDKIKTIEKYLK
ncbi:MAG: hypothetical protein PHH54_01600 [Candidatus Nanoarchaeia archaeon]|nr:hypothetical protein [Candidatus Nanoarchaeia archaeon]MDD5740657.1 hypothetical protein [Candidatus Nanoarchaeia archaeon]